MSSTKVIKTPNAPEPVGPYNQAIKAGNFIYCSGQIAIDPVSNKINCLGRSHRLRKSYLKIIKNVGKDEELHDKMEQAAWENKDLKKTV